MVVYVLEAWNTNNDLEVVIFDYTIYSTLERALKEKKELEKITTFNYTITEKLVFDK